VSGPGSVDTPLISIADELELRRKYLFRLCDTKQELHDWILVYLDIDFPDCIVDPESTSSPMDMVWEVYSEARAGNNPAFRRALYYACRDGFKTLGAAVIEVLCVVHLDRNVAHMAAISDQAMKAQEYVKRAFRRPYLRDFVEGDNERMTKLVRWYNPDTKHSLTRGEYEALSTSEQAKHQEIARVLMTYVEKEQYIKIVICTMAGANSEHVPLFVVDEVDVVNNPAAYEEAKSIPSGRNGKLPITILTSTRKKAHGLVQKEIDQSKKTKLQIRHWNIIDITARCEPERHKPHLPKLKLYRSNDELRHVDEQTYGEMNFKERESFVPDVGFAGCGDCKLFTVCRTRLATHQTSTSPMLKPIEETIGKFHDHSIEMAQAQLMCWKPSSEGLIYGRFDRTRHILSPAQAYHRIWGEPHPDPKASRTLTKAMLIDLLREREVEWYGGIDWGDTHNFVHVNGFKDGHRMFVTHCVSVPELEQDQQLEVSEPFKQYGSLIYGDTESPGSIRTFRKHGFRMAKWKKLPGSVVDGINAVRYKFNPPLGAEPELFFIRDIEDDPGMDQLINKVAEHHWKPDATGKPTGIPSDTGKDEPDALRYMVMNVFPMKGRIAGAANIETHVTPTVTGLDGQKVYDPNNWMQQLIAEHTGVPFEAPAQPSRGSDGKAERPRMTIEAPPGSGLMSYYADDEPGKPGSGKKKRDEAPNGRKGKRGRLVWDI
jgi:hypothetical protein